jgi:EAL domain-containing protein (putative c-di-GMP-specific phosphodiesterase class I)
MAQDGTDDADTPKVSITPTRPTPDLSADLDRARRTRGLVEQLIAQPSLLGPDFTPIRRLEPRAPGLAPVLGWKARGRGTPGTEIADTLSLLAQAAELGLVERLDWAFRAHTFNVAVDSGMSGELHLTPEPETFGTACPPRLAVAILRGRRALSVCAELHEDSFVDSRRLLAATEEMRAWGWQVVVADVSGTTAEQEVLRLLPTLRPAYVQVDLGRPDQPSETVLAAWRDAALDAGAQVLALGVDDGARLERAISLGATYGRGTLLGRAVTVPS